MMYGRFCRGIAVAFLFLTYSSTAGISGQLFTVQDSIEMARFSDPAARDPAAQIKHSPDSTHFLVITTRGLIASDQVESTLWLFDRSSIQSFLAAKDQRSAPQPVALVRLRGRLEADQDDSYGSLITSATWSADSRSILYLGENSEGNRQLFRIAISGGSPKALTPPNQSVQTFDASADTVVYTAGPPTKAVTTPPGTPINPSAMDITGQTLSELLFPENWGKLDQVRASLWVARKGQNLEIKDPRSGRAFILSASNDAFKVAIAPDQRTAVIAIPVEEIPVAWGAYTPAMTELRFKPKPGTPENKKDFMWPMQYGLLDIDHGTLSPLIDAPSGVLAGYYDFPFATWSADGSAVLVANSFIPLSPSRAAADSEALLPCAAVVVRLPGRHSECVVRSRSTEKDNAHPLFAFDGAFVVGHDELRLRLRAYGRLEIETYRYQDGAWKQIDARADKGDEAQGRVSLRQGLNSPPALWATDQAGREKKLWDPTPHLRSIALGDASVFRWKDATGYEWSASLIKPVGYQTGRRYPLVIQTHGFHNEAEFITDGAFTTSFAARQLAAVGFVVLEVRDRHDHMVTPEEASDMVRGFETAVDQLVAAGLIDPKRVGIIGFSRTCYYAESALLYASERYAAASIADGVDESYMQSMFFDVDRTFIEGASIYGAKPFGPGLKNWVDAAPGFHLDRVQTPLMITAITSGSVLEEWEIYSSLRQQGKPVWFLYIPHGQHILQNPLDRLASQQANVDWFRFWLQGYEDPAVGKAGQYRYWENLCDVQFAQNPGRPKYCLGTRH